MTHRGRLQTWSGAPAGSQSFAVTEYNPNAPIGSGWWHWPVMNLPADSTGVAEGARHGRADFEGPGFGGARAPVGNKLHRGIFTAYALNTDKIDMPADASAVLIGFILNANRHVT